MSIGKSRTWISSFTDCRLVRRRSLQSASRAAAATSSGEETGGGAQEASQVVAPTCWSFVRRESSGRLTSPSKNPVKYYCYFLCLVRWQADHVRERQTAKPSNAARASSGAHQSSGDRGAVGRAQQPARERAPTQPAQRLLPLQSRQLQ